MRVVKPKVPIETQGRINRMQSDMETAQNDMTARDNISKGSAFILHDVAYRATKAIVKGTAVEPGKNCLKINLDEMIGGN